MDMQVQDKTEVADMERPLAGKVAVVTGSTSGIGLAVARALAGCGIDHAFGLVGGITTAIQYVILFLLDAAGRLVGRRGHLHRL